MKTVKLIMQGAHGGKKLLLQLVADGGAQGISFGQMRDRIKLIDAIEAAGDTLALEDAPFALLKEIVDGAKFTAADRDLFAVIEASITPCD